MSNVFIIKDCIYANLGDQFEGTFCCLYFEDGTVHFKECQSSKSFFLILNARQGYGEFISIRPTGFRDNSLPWYGLYQNMPSDEKFSIFGHSVNAHLRIGENLQKYTR